MEAVTYRPQVFQTRKWVLGVLGIVGLAYILDFMLGFSLKAAIVLTAQVFLYVLLFNRPVWALAALIVGQLTLSGSMIFIGAQQISVNLIWAIMTLLLLVPILRRRGGIELGSRARRIIIPSIILLCMATIANLVNLDQDSTVQYLRLEFVWLVILLFLPAAVKNESDLKRLALVALITCTVSAIFALSQYVIPGLRGGLGSRQVGLTASPVHLACNLSLVLLPAIAMYFLRGVNSRARKFILLSIIIMGLGLYATFTRSGIYSLALGLLFMVLLMRGKPRKELFLITLAVAAAFFSYINFIDTNRYTPGTVEETQGEPRWVLWQVGTTIALDHPLFGIGANQFKEVSPEYASTLPPALIEQGAVKALGNDAAHNDFITIWSSFGTIALLAYLWLLINIFRNFMEASRHSHTRFLKAFTIGCLGVIVAYIMNAATHNFMSFSMLLWILGGFSLATTKLAAKGYAKTKVSQVDTGEY